MEILDLLIAELGVNPSHFDIFKTEAEGMLRANLYHRSESMEQVLGLDPHMDGGLLTILLQDDVSGLEVVKDGQWVRVMPHKHELCINMADMLQVGLSHAAAPAALVSRGPHPYCIIKEGKVEESRFEIDGLTSDDDDDDAHCHCDFWLFLSLCRFSPMVI
jgi:hypothetical protein